MINKLLFTALLFTFTSYAFSQVPNYVPTNGLVGYWPFNGNANDESGNNLNGSVIGATLTADRNGNPNSAYNFDFATVGFGTQTDEVYIPFSPLFNTPSVSISIWVYQRQYVWSGNTNPPFSTIAARFQYGYSNPNGEVWMLNSGTNGCSAFANSPNINLNSWTHIVSTFENGIGKIYINGQLIDTQNNMPPLNIIGNSGISIGESNQANGYYWPTDGVIDDFALFNRALTPQEITNLYTSTVPVSCLPAYVPTSGLVGYWPFCGNANDESGNGNNGTVNGATLTSDRNGNVNSAFSFDGINDLIDVGNPTLLMANPNSYTQSAWVYLTDTPNGVHSYPIISKRHDDSGNDWGTPIARYDGTFWFFADDANYSGANYAISPIVPQSIWKHLTFIKDGDNYSIYINGVFAVNAVDNHIMNGSTNNLIIGAQLAWPEYFKGFIDEVGVWNRALTPTEITQIYTCTSVTPPLACTSFLGEDQAVCAGTSVQLNVNSTSVNSSLALLETYSHDVGSEWTHNFSVVPGQTYTVRVSAQFSMGTVCPNFEMDPAYWIPPYNGGVALTHGCNSAWYIQNYCNGTLGMRPTPDVYNPQHTYDYPIVANSNVLTVGFADCCLGDNCGSISFELHQSITSSTYLWSNGATTPTINVSPTSTTTYTCIVTTNGVSCTDEVTVIVNNPVIDLGADVTVCGTSTTLTAPSGYDSYLWSNGATTNTTTVSANGTYSCIVTQGGCSAADSIDVTFIDATISASNTSICSGEQVNLLIQANTSQQATTNSATELWFQTYLQQNAAFTRNIIDGNSLVVAGSYWPGWPGGTTDQLVTKLNCETGNLEWQHVRSPGGDHDGFGGVQKLANGNYIFFGQQNAQGTQYFDGFWSIYNPNGIEQSYGMFSVPGSNSGSDVQTLPNGNLIFSGNSGDGVTLNLLNQNLSTLASQTFFVGSWNNNALAVSSNRVYSFVSFDANYAKLACYDFNLSQQWVLELSNTDASTTSILDIVTSGEEIYLVGSQTISGLKRGVLFHINSSGQIVSRFVDSNSSEYTSVVMKNQNCLISRSNLTSGLSVNSTLLSFQNDQLQSEVITFNGGGQFVSYDMRVDGDFLYATGVVGPYHWLGFPSATKLALNLNQNYIWSTGATNPTINVSPTSTTTYTCTTTTNGVSCTDSVTVVVNNPTVDLGNDVTACGTSTTLTAPTGYDSYLWSIGGTTNTTTVTSNGTYTCTVTQGGCSASDSIDVVLVPLTINTTNISAAATYTWENNGQTYTSSGVYTGTTVNCETQVLNLTITPNSSTLSLQVFLDGYYINSLNPAAMTAARYNNLVASGSANPGANTDVDVITVELRSPSNLDVVAYSVSPILQTNGSVQCVFPAGALGGTFYLVVKHRAANPLWSANPIILTTSTTYDFANNLGSAYSDGDLSLAPMHTIVSGLYGIWLGELNDDGYLDATDYSNLELDIYASGYLGLYLLDGDFNGDTYVDASDFAVFDSNSKYGLYEQRPYAITTNVSIGQSYQGGIVAYILQAGDPGYDATMQHGLIAAPSDQGSAPWGCFGTEISGADGTAIGTGDQNTVDIMNGCSEVGIAARLCGDLVLGGYSDWYLPSKDELNLLYLNKVAIGGFASSSYWSSTEANANLAWLNAFDLSFFQYSNQKYFSVPVRAVRAF